MLVPVLNQFCWTIVKLGEYLPRCGRWQPRADHHTTKVPEWRDVMNKLSLEGIKRREQMEAESQRSLEEVEEGQGNVTCPPGTILKEAFQERLLRQPI